ncbi:bifunctional adenosylcobinamide kinase/adenosylcobinamide-phosphate guanylyltransferase [Butyrivibrio sp. WCD2001]|uniref:bifunctional adenosylcobinamide kinase/adenosylcobinamide-phosphate guanylyltransferase n=1 Tax=Butyrivibrio sp. WCD2001 TaxID=1280681 RepID=UPI000403783E|nr:bifunctional adenosylcobinamide kinase/adenosylcobinamide-phosphate guanylyltransferase [Butyrivibrio sp. WCD2001]
MIVFVLGIPDSGKSSKAEEIAVRLAGDGQKIYIATMIPFGEEGKKRVEKHRKLREGKGFETIECPVKIQSLIEDFSVYSDNSTKTENKSGIHPQSQDTCLLECMSNLVGNEMHSDDNSKLSDDEFVKYITQSVKAFGKSVKNLVIVSNSFSLEGEGYDEDTKRYTRLIDLVNNDLKKYADEVYEFLDERWTHN